MGEYIKFVRPVWQSGSAPVFRSTARAIGCAVSGHLLAGSGGLVDDVAAFGWPGDFGHGGATGGAGGVGNVASSGEAGARAARIEQYRGAKPSAEAVAAGGGGGGQ